MLVFLSKQLQHYSDVVANATARGMRRKDPWQEEIETSEWIGVRSAASRLKRQFTPRFHSPDSILDKVDAGWRGVDGQNVL